MKLFGLERGETLDAGETGGENKTQQSDEKIEFVGGVWWLRNI